MHRFFALTTMAMLTLSGPAHAAEDYVMMKVNKQDVTAAEVQRMWQGLFPEGQAAPLDQAEPAMRERILRAIMAEKIVYGEAVKAGTDKSEKLQKELEDVKRKLIVRSFLDEKTGAMITDAEIKKEYETVVANAKEEREVRARHILVETEAAAKEAKKKLDSGKKFEEVAKEMSKDPGSAAKGGDLGYFQKGAMVKEFADAAFAMKKGEVSAPVKSGFGYHIIKVEDARKVTPPTLAEVKDQIKARMQEKKLNDYIGGLVKAAEVQVFDAKGKEVPFNRDLNAPPALEVKEDKRPGAKPAAPEKKAN